MLICTITWIAYCGSCFHLHSNRRIINVGISCLTKHHFVWYLLKQSHFKNCLLYHIWLKFALTIQKWMRKTDMKSHKVSSAHFFKKMVSKSSQKFCFYRQFSRSQFPSIRIVSLIIILHQTGKFCWHNILVLLLPFSTHTVHLLCMVFFGSKYFVKNCNVWVGKVQIWIGLSYDKGHVSHQNYLNF